MAINLLGNKLAGPAALNPSFNGISMSAPMGIKAFAPTSNLQKVPTTLPTNQKDPVVSMLTSPLRDPKWSGISSAPATSTQTPSSTGSYSASAQTNNPIPSAPSQPVQPTQPANTSPTFGGLLGQMVNQQNSTQNKTANTSASNLQSLGASNLGTSGPAYDAYQKAVADEQNLKSGIAKEYGNIESQAIPLEFQQGREQVAARQNASLIDAAQNATSEKAAALGYGIQGNQAQQSANTSAGSIALTGQGQTYGALQNAAGLAAPQVTSYGQTAFNPTENSFGSNGGGNLDPQTQSTSFAQKVMSGQMTYDQAVSSMGYAGTAGKTFLDNAITSAGGNPLQLQASGAATQGVIGDQATQVEGYKSALQQGQNLQNQLSDLITTFGLNPNDINSVNSGIQAIARNVSDPHYKMLNNYVHDIANTYAQILTPPGGASTDTSRGIAESMLDATASGQSLLTVMQSLDQAAKAKIAGVPTQTGPSSQQSSSTNAPAGFGWNG